MNDDFYNRLDQKGEKKKIINFNRKMFVVAELLENKCFFYQVEVGDQKKT